MIDPSKILATKVVKAGVLILVKVDGKPKWLWRDEIKPEKKTTTTPFDDYLTK